MPIDKKVNDRPKEEIRIMSVFQTEAVNLHDQYIKKGYKYFLRPEKGALALIHLD